MEGPPLELRIVSGEVHDLQCAICLSIVTNPKQCTNGHLFCDLCISECIQKNPRCPSCRCTLTERELSRCLFVEKHLRTLSVWCIYHFYYDEVGRQWRVDERGCNQTCELQAVTKHEVSCEYAWCVCAFSKSCDVKIRKRDYEVHVEGCEWRLVGCQYCRTMVEACRMEGHVVGECPGVPVVCELCGESVRRSEMEGHLQKVCAEFVILCPYGCKEKVTRKNMKTHLLSNLLEHFESLRLSHQKALQSIESHYQTELRRKDKEIQLLKKKVKNETKIVWNIEGWKRTVLQGYVPSKKFDLGGCKWYFGVYPDGDIDESRGYLSIYLFLDKPPPKGKTLSVEFRINILNHKNSKDSIRKELKTTFPLKENQPGWGDRKAVKTSLINEENGFLVNDELRIETDIFIKQVSFQV